MSEKILPTPEELRQLLRYEPDTGKLYWRPRSPEMFEKPRYWKRWNTMFCGKEAFTSMNSKGYFETNMSGRSVKAHRAAWAIFHGVWPKEEIDHINGHRHDNRISNLREASRLQNSKNRAFEGNNTSGYKGVSWNTESRRWVAQISVDGKKIYLGKYDCPKEAYDAYCSASRRHHAEFSRVD